VVRRAGDRRSRRTPALTAAGAGAAGALLAVIAQPPAIATALGAARPLLLIAAAWLAFGIGALLILRSPPRAAVVLILAGAAALPLLAGLGPPRSSDDLYRYLWDGRVQAAGINPYRYVPAAPELAGLRDDVLCPDRSRWCIPPGTTRPPPPVPVSNPAPPPGPVRSCRVAR
jgi:hypothetical protein